MHTCRRISLLALTALALAAAGCAAGPRPVSRQSLLSDAPRSRESRCGVSARPERLPAAGELVEVEALRAEAARLWSEAGRPAGYVLFSLRYDANGTNVRRAVLETSAPAALADTLRKLVFAHRRRAAPAEGEWAVRLRVDLGPQPVLRVGRHEVCTPAPRDLDRRMAGAGFDVRGRYFATTPTAADPTLAWVRVRLDAHGNVTDARIERGMLSSRTWETRVLSYVRALSFVPAMEDGYPVPGETSIPVSTRI
jgi:hypothetical protein